MKYYLQVLKQYVNFKGRARRKEYWMFYLFNMIFIILAMIIDDLTGLTLVEGEATGIITTIYIFAILLPALGVGVRRLHDVGKSGWFLLIIFIPLIGFLYLLYLNTKDSDPGENQYGPNPKEVIV